MKRNQYGRIELPALDLFKLLLGVVLELVNAGKPFSALTVTKKAREDNPDFEIPHEPARGITYALFSGSGGMVSNPGSALYEYNESVDSEGKTYRVYSERPVPLHRLVERLFKDLQNSQELLGVAYDIDRDGFIFVPLGAVSKWAVRSGLTEAERDQFKADLKIALKNNGGHAADLDGRPAMAVLVEENFLDLEDDDIFDDEGEDDFLDDEDLD